MNKFALKKIKGFTLLEMMLVAVIIAMVLYAAMSYFQQRALQARIDRTSAQMQQILNAALAYYVSNGTWPKDLPCLKGSGGANCTIQYIPTTFPSPWLGVDYVAGPDTVNSVFYVYVPITFASASKAPLEVATVIAGNLPLSYASGQAAPPAGTPPAQNNPCAASSAECTVVSTVNIPGDNLNNARAVNFAGLYRNGGCVPVPSCPVDALGNTMLPQVFVVPVSVSGYNDTAAGNNNVYPISSFTAYAKGPGPNPPNCADMSQSGAGQNCTPISGNIPASGQYWRACLQIVTEKGEVNTPNALPTWGNSVTLMAITRCAVNQEPAGSKFTVYQ